MLFVGSACGKWVNKWFSATCNYWFGKTNGSVLHVTIGLSTFDVAINWLSITKKFREKIKIDKFILP